MYANRMAQQGATSLGETALPCTVSGPRATSITRVVDGSLRSCRTLETAFSGRRVASPRAELQATRSKAAQTSATLVGPRQGLPASSGDDDLLGLAAFNNTLTEVPPQLADKSADRKLVGREVEQSAMRKCIELQLQYPNGRNLPNRWTGKVLDAAYERCGLVTSEYAKTFYLGTQLMTPEKARAVWAIYVWCRRTDELVDGPNASRITPAALDRWEARLEALFDGRPYDILDAALADTVNKFPVHIQPFRDMIDGMRMDLTKMRYETYDELYEYCYRVAGTVALMTMPVMGIDPSYKGPLEKVYSAALALGTANQLTNILRDVGEDVAERNRIYVPQEDLRRFGITDQEVTVGLFAPTTGHIQDRWRSFMAFQIARAQEIFAAAEEGVDYLDQNARWPVWSALILYRQILPAIEANEYNNFTKRAYVPKWRKLASLPAAFARAQAPFLFNKKQ